MHDFRKFLENFGKYMCLIVSTLLLWLVPLLFARLESCSFECNIPLDFNEFLSVRYNVSIMLQRYTFFLKNVQNVLLFLNQNHYCMMGFISSTISMQG